MLRRTVLTALVAASLAPSVWADSENTERQIIVITDYGIFPMVTYVHAGEKVIFNNQAEASRSVRAVLRSGETTPDWQTPTLAHGETYLLQIETDTVLEFYSSFSSKIIGAFSFDEPVEDIEKLDTLAFEYEE